MISQQTYDPAESTANVRVLVVDDQASFCRHIQAILSGEGFLVEVANNGKEALKKLSSNSFSILITDIKMPGMSGLELYQAAAKIDPDLSCIVMTAFGSIPSAVSAIKQGVIDYLQKPFEPELLLMVMKKALKEMHMVQEIRDLRKEVGLRYSFGNIIGKSHKMQALYELIERVASTNVRVLITGETGVGKELVAKAIHFNSLRKTKPFVAINCGAMVETLLEAELFGYEKGAFTGADQTRKGKFEYAHGGTLFLDEIGDIAPSMQVKLLRVLQEGKFFRVGGNLPIDSDVRIISATNKDLTEEIKEDRFRMELFYRLDVVTIHIPPLRERIEDIPLIAKHFIDRFNGQLGKSIKNISSHGMTQLMEYSWPGNVRELENALERAFVLTDGETIDHFLLPGQSRHPDMKTLSDMVDIEIPFTVAKSLVTSKFEKSYLIEALKSHKGNVSETARQTGLTSRTVWRKIKQHGLNVNEIKRSV